VKTNHLLRTLFLLLTAVPLVLGIGYALLYSLGLSGVIGDGLTGQYWQDLLASPALWWSLGFSLYVAVVAIGLSIIFALLLALTFRQRLSKGVLSYAIYLPLAFPAIVMAFYSFQLLSKGGLLSRLSYQIGLTSQLAQFPDWVNDQWGIGIIATHVFMATPFFTILFWSIFQNEKLDDYQNLAATLGASVRQIRHRITIPILLQKARSTLILYFMFVLGSYEIPLLLGSQSPQMVSVFTIQKLQRFNLQDIPQAYAICVLYTLLILLVLPRMLNAQPKSS